MSERLAISAAMSVLMMSIYVLFGADAVRVPLSHDSLTAPISLSAPSLKIDASSLLLR